MRSIIITIFALIILYCLITPPRYEYLDNPPPTTPPTPSPSPAPIPGTQQVVIDNITHNITTLQNKLEQAINQLTALKAQVTSNTSNIDLVQQSMNTINKLISDLQTHIASGK